MIIPEYLYAQIQQAMPIPCVDLLVSDAQGRVLLVKRKKEPAAGQWWFPGGRVYFRETRAQAAVRKLKEECGLEASSLRELGTFDVIFENAPPSVGMHGITTLFHIHVQEDQVRLDDQSTTSYWRTPQEWRCECLHPFVQEGLNVLLNLA